MTTTELQELVEEIRNTEIWSSGMRELVERLSCEALVMSVTIRNVEKDIEAFTCDEEV